MQPLMQDFFGFPLAGGNRFPNTPAVETVINPPFLA
jgi:hypothetical protein